MNELHEFINRFWKLLKKTYGAEMDAAFWDYLVNESNDIARTFRDAPFYELVKVLLLDYNEHIEEMYRNGRSKKVQG